MKLGRQSRGERETERTPAKKKMGGIRPLASILVLYMEGGGRTHMSDLSAFSISLFLLNNRIDEGTQQRLKPPARLSTAREQVAATAHQERPTAWRRTRSGREREGGGDGGAEREQEVAVREEAVERWPI
uniref:Uncharacterized protein n=1 Tax=Oryza rufipogon TaxID=4529 RepID=A0A0E0Q1Q4_ORYRU